MVWPTLGSRTAKEQEQEQSDMMTALLDSCGSVRSVFVDFRKAFDLVDHNILFTKLSKYNILNFCCCGLLSIYLTANSVSGSKVQCPRSKASKRQCQRVHG